MCSFTLPTRDLLFWMHLRSFPPLLRPHDGNHCGGTLLSAPVHVPNCSSNTSFPLHEPRRMCPTSWSEVRAAFTWGLMSQYWLRRGILHRPTHTLQANNHTKAVWCCENNNNNNNNTPICLLSFILICVLIKTGLWHFSVCAHLFLLGFLMGGGVRGFVKSRVTVFHLISLRWSTAAVAYFKAAFTQGVCDSLSPL